MNAQVGSLYTSLTLESSSFSSGLRRAVEQSTAASESIVSNFEKIHEGTKLFIEAELTRSAIEKINSALEYAASLATVSKQLGVTTDDLQTFRYAATQTGISQEQMDKGLQKFTKSLGDARAGSAEAIGVFKELGFTDADIKHLDVHEALGKTADGLAQLRDGVTRSTPEVKLFGKAGQDIDPLFRQGRAGIDGLAQAANDLGVVLSQDQIENADKTAHKLAELKLVLSTKIAAFVAEDSTEIVTFIGHVETLIGKFETLNNKMAQARDYFKIGEGQNLSGPLGQLASLVNGGDQVQTGQNEVASATADLARLKDEQAEREKPAWLRRQDDEIKHFGQDEGGGTKGFTDPAAAEAARKRADAAQRKAEEEARKALAARQKEAERQKDVAAENKSLDDAYLSGKSGLTANVIQRAVNEREQLVIDTDDKLKELADQVTAGKRTVEDAKELRLKIERNAGLQADVINQRENVALEQERFQVESTQLGYLHDMLGSASDLARTSKDRLAIALRLLAADKEVERDQLQAKYDDWSRPESEQHYSDADHKSAQLGLLTLDARYGGKEELARKQLAGPGAQYLDGLTKSAGEAKEALQAVQVDGLKQLDDGLVGLVSGTESVSGAFKKMADTIIADLARIAIEKAIVGPLANALFGSAGGSAGFSLGSFDTSGVNDDGSLAGFSLPGFATGGGFQVGGYGGTDSQLMKFWATPGEMVNITKGEGGSASAPTVHQTIQVQGGVDLATRSETYRLASATAQSTKAALAEQRRRAA